MQSRPFFASCEHYVEEPGANGQEELVVEFADDHYLDMALLDYAILNPARGCYDLVLYVEPDPAALADVGAFFSEDVQPSLTGPQEKVAVLGGAAESGSDQLLLGAANDIGGEDHLFVFEGTDCNPSCHVSCTGRKPNSKPLHIKVISTKRSILDQAWLPE